MKVHFFFMRLCYQPDLMSTRNDITVKLSFWNSSLV